jgi:uncharacterized protein
MQSVVHVRSSASVKIISLDTDEVITRLRKKAREALELNKEIVSVWLFGSLARGEALPGSDADILIVLKRSELQFSSRIDQFSDQFSNVGVPVDVLPVTTSELETKKNDPFWAKICTERQRLA